MNEPTQLTDDRGWGFWMTAVWSAAILLLFSATQAAFVGAYIFAIADPAHEIDFGEALGRLHYNGDIISVATLLGTLIGVPAILGVIKLKRGARAADYFPRTVPPPRAVALWLLAMAAWSVGTDMISLFIGDPVVPDFMREAYASADSKILLWVAIVVAAPLFEETLFRGFMLRGLSRSRLGTVGAIVVTALVWALIHGQYDWYGRATIFIFGLLLGAARVRTGTMLVPLMLHAAANGVATLEVAILPNNF